MGTTSPAGSQDLWGILPSFYGPTAAGSRVQEAHPAGQIEQENNTRRPYLESE